MSVFSVKGVTKAYGGVVAVNGCTFELERAKIYGLIGPNGSGKSTLLDCICGSNTVDQGEITFMGHRLNGLLPHEICRLGVGHTFQMVRLFKELTLLENLLVASRKPSMQEAVEAALELLDYVGLSRFADSLANDLSYGQQKLVELVRVLVQDPQMLLLDEPAGGVNPTLLVKLLKYISDQRELGKTVLLVEHNMEVIATLCDWVFVLDHGDLIAEGPPDEVRSNEQVIDAYFGRIADS